ncbi:MAG: hypothetical protein LBH25_04835 [Fibromonadaceae bacterium]|jgi:uncharacterized protein (TIGR02145 family)|nr:hypothetical protein [Fibromonadaceae bacterium]
MLLLYKMVSILIVASVFLSCSDFPRMDVGIVYGEDLIDEGGHKYKTVIIGSQTWMAKNLDYRGEDGKLGYCYNDESGEDNGGYCSKYGRLYDWATAMALGSEKNGENYVVSGKHQGICPDGWHIPSSTEYDTLIKYVGKSSGTKLKSKDAESWLNNGNGTDDFGFAALPGGRYRNGNGFTYAGQDTRWWSATESDGKQAKALFMRNDKNEADNTDYPKTDFHSVRCIKD